MMSRFLSRGGVTIFALWYSAASRRRSKPENSSDLLVAIVVIVNELCRRKGVCTELPLSRAVCKIMRWTTGCTSYATSGRIRRGTTVVSGRSRIR